MKKLMSLVLALAMILSLAACGGKTTGTSPDSAGDSQQETPATSDGAFPEKQVTIIMPWSLGGGPDTIARQVASYGEKYLGVPVIVENHTGGSGTIAMNDALQAEDDGYTMVVANGPLFSLTPSFINVNYTLDDITPLIGMRITEFVVLTNSKSGITNIDELKAYAAEGNTIKYATTGGPGNDSYTMISVLFKLLDIPAEPVPYDGGQEDHPLQIGDVVDLSAQIIIHQVIVDALDAADVLRQDQGAQAPLPDAAVQVGPGHCPLRVGPGILGLLRVGPGILGLLRVSRGLLDSPILGPGLPCVVLPRLCGQGGKAQRTG